MYIVYLKYTKQYKVKDNYKTTFQTWNKLASIYQNRFMDVDLYDDTYDIFCQLIEKPNAKVFEVGCGPGNVTKYLLSKRPDFKIEATDIAPNMIELAKENNPRANFKIMDCREIDIIQDKFDAIMNGFCMPYLSKDGCAKFIKDAAYLLNNDGILYFSAIEDDYSKSNYETSSDGQHTMFVYYHQEDYLIQFLKENNFETIEIIRKHFTKTDKTTSTHIIFIARKKQA